MLLGHLCRCYYVCCTDDVSALQAGWARSHASICQVIKTASTLANLTTSHLPSFCGKVSNQFQTVTLSWVSHFNLWLPVYNKQQCQVMPPYAQRYCCQHNSSPEVQGTKMGSRPHHHLTAYHVPIGCCSRLQVTTVLASGISGL